MSDTELIREYARVLTEDSVGADWGISIKPNRLYDTFINPFVDVIRVTRAEAEKLSSSLQRLVLTIKEAIVSTAIPVVKGKYESIKARERTQIARIDSKYAEVFRRVQAGIDQPDFQLALFMRSPGAYLASRLLSASGEVAKEVALTLTGRATFDQNIELGTGRVKNKVSWTAYHEGVLREGTEQALAAAIDRSPLVREMQDAALKARAQTLGDVVKFASSIASAKTVEQLTSILSTDINVGVQAIDDVEATGLGLEMAKSIILGKLVEMLRADPVAKSGSPAVKSLYDNCIRKIASMR